MRRCRDSTSCDHRRGPRRRTCPGRRSAAAGPCRSARPTTRALALAVVDAPDGELLVASCVLPWRGAGAHWPGDADARLADRFREALQTHQRAIEQARADRPVVWGGDRNLGLSGTERAGATENRADLLQAWADLGIEPRTGHLAHRIDGLFTIDHIAVPSAWPLQATEMHDPGLSDHALYVVRATRT